MPAFLTFDSNEVCDLVGIGPLLLNKFVERKTYGIQPSVRSGRGRGGRRLFSPDDVYGIAFVWWLFESGLRSGVIQEVLDRICAPAKGIASEAGRKLVERKIRLVEVSLMPSEVRRGRRVPKKPNHSVGLITIEDPEAAKYLTSELRIPVELYYSILLDNMKKHTGLPEGI